MRRCARCSRACSRSAWDGGEIRPTGCGDCRVEIDKGITGARKHIELVADRHGCLAVDANQIVQANVAGRVDQVVEVTIIIVVEIEVIFIDIVVELAIVDARRDITFKAEIRAELIAGAGRNGIGIDTGFGAVRLDVEIAVAALQIEAGVF